MFRILVIAAMFALVAPTIAAAQQPDQHHGPPAKGGPKAGPRPGPGPGPQFKQAAPAHGPMATPHAAVVPHPLGAHAVGPHPVGPVAGHPFAFHGHAITRAHIAPFAYPQGYAYRRWAAGAVLPPLFLAPAYYYGEWAALGLPPPQPGFQWVRYGPDLLLVDTSNGQVADVAYGVFY